MHTMFEDDIQRRDATRVRKGFVFEGILLLGSKEGARTAIDVGREYYCQLLYPGSLWVPS